MSLVNNYLNTVRRDFSNQELSVESVNENPRIQLEKWIEEAVDSQILEPNAMVISTVGKDQMPSSRVVYLRGLTEEGLSFYTNYLSRKGEEIESNSKLCALFFFPELERQVRVEGQVKKLSSEESDAYFNARPLESKLGAWASQQSQELKNREELLERLEKFRQQFGDEVPRPEHWGGYVLEPQRYEFWQGRPSRLHDRVVFQLDAQQWKLSRVAP